MPLIELIKQGRRILVYFGILLLGAYSIFLLSACPEIAGGISGNSATAASSNTNGNAGFADESLIAYRNGSIALFDAHTGKPLWETKLDGKVYPYSKRAVGKNKDRSLITWADENASIHSALIDSEMNVILARRDTSPAAAFENRLAMTILERPGLEGTHKNSTEIWNVESGKVEKSFPGASPINSAAPRAGSDHTIVLSGPPSEDDIDVYGHTTREQVSLFDLMTGNSLFSMPIDKDYGASFDLAAVSGEFVILAYAIEVLVEEIVCLNSSGKVVWRQKENAQLHRSPVFPFHDAFSRLACAVSPSGDNIAFYTVPAPGRGRLYVFGIADGKTIWIKDFSEGASLPNAIEYGDTSISLEFGYGKRKVWLDSSNGDVISDGEHTVSGGAERPSETGFEIKSPSGTVISATRGNVSVKPASGTEWNIPTAAFGGRLPQSAKFGGKDGSIIRLTFAPPGLSSDLFDSSLEALLDLKNRNIIVGDQLSAKSWQFYGTSSLIIAGEKIYQIGDEGKPVKTTSLFATSGAKSEN